MTKEVADGRLPSRSGRERRHGRHRKRHLPPVSHLAASQRQKSRADLAVGKELRKDVTRLITEAEGTVDLGGAPRTAPPKAQSSGKPPGGNSREGKK